MLLAAVGTYALAAVIFYNVCNYKIQENETKNQKSIQNVV